MLATTDPVPRWTQVDETVPTKLYIHEVRAQTREVGGVPTVGVWQPRTQHGLLKVVEVIRFERLDLVRVGE